MDVAEPVRVDEVDPGYLNMLTKYGFSAVCPVCDVLRKFEYSAMHNAFLCEGHDKTCAVYVMTSFIAKNPDGGDFWCRGHPNHRKGVGMRAPHRVEVGQDLSWTAKAWGSRCDGKAVDDD